MLRFRSPLLRPLQPILVAIGLLAAPALLAQSPTPDTSATAATTAPQGGGADSVRIDTLQQLVQDIEDPTRRDELVQRLRALIAAAQQTPTPAAPAGAIESLVGFFNRLAAEASQTVENVVDQIAHVPQRLRAFATDMEDPARRSAFLDQSLRAGGVMLAALAMHVLAWLLVQRPRRLLAHQRSEQPLRPVARSWRLGVRLLLDLLPPLFGIGAVMLGLSLVRVDTAGAAFALAVVTATALRSAVRALLAGLLAPHTPELRLLPVRDDPARALAGSIRRASALAIYGWFAIVAIRAGLADADLTAALTSLYSLALLGMGTVLVLRFRRWPMSFEAPATDAKAAAPAAPASDDPNAGDDPAGVAPRTRRRSRAWAVAGAAARFWWLAALVYMFGLYALWISGTTDVFATALTATAISLAWGAGAVLLFVLAGAGLDRLGARLVAAAKPLPTIRRRIPSYLSGARVVVGIALAIAAAGFVFEAWGLESLTALQSTVVQTALTTALGVVAVLFLAFAAIDVTTAVTDAYLRRKQQQGLDSSKMRTLVPLLQKAVRGIVWTLTGLTVLGQLGISIGPILASIGVLGLAVGFGAQALVKDIITGVFILLEDTVSVGDVVQIDGTGGAVEAINIRTIRLRDLHGNVHTIPYSSVDKFTNMTKGFSRYVVECGVAYREDVDEVIKVLKQLGAELQKDPVFGPNMTEPIEILGLDRFDDSAVVVRARLITKAGQQWSTGREFNRRMKRAFDERGIEIPFPQRTVWIGEDKQGKSPPLFVAARDGDPAVLTGPRKDGGAAS